MTKAKKDTDISDAAVDQEKFLVEQLEKHFGVEYSGDTDKFLEDCNKESLKFAKEKQNSDPIENARFDDKLGQLRLLWADNLKKKDTPRQAEIRKALEDEKLTVALSFPDDKTWCMHGGGIEDTGTLDQPIEAIVAAADRLANPSKY